MISLTRKGRVTAHITGDETYTRQLMEGWDAHLATANASFDLGIQEEALSSKHPDHDKVKDKFKKMRSKAKAINFALPYGGTEFAISKSMGCSVEEAKVAIQKYYDKYAGIKEAMDKAKEEVLETGVLSNLFGRKRHFKKEINNYTGLEEYPMKAFRQALNFKVQSSSADMMRTALNMTRDLFNSNPQWCAKLRMTVHDELIATCKSNFVNEAGEATKSVLEKCISLNVPIIADLSIGNNYEEAK